MGWRAEESWGGKSETVQGLRSMRPSAHEGSLQLERTPSLRADAGVGQGTGLGRHSTGWIADSLVSLQSIACPSTGALKVKQPEKWRRKFQEAGEKPS